MRFASRAAKHAADRGISAQDGAAGIERDHASRDIFQDCFHQLPPSLEFLRPRQELVLHPADADRLGLARGDLVSISSNGSTVEAAVAPRESVKEGTGHLTEGTAEQNANALTNGLPPLIQVSKVAEGQ